MATTNGTSPRLTRLRGVVHPATLPLLVAAGGIAAATMVHLVDPHEPGNYPVCPWLALTGTYCPGCGSMRAVAALTHLDLAGAAQMNIALLLLLPLVAWSWGTWLYRSFRPSPPPTATDPPPRMANPAWYWALLAAILGYWLVRNLPFATFLAPGGLVPPAFS